MNRRKFLIASILTTSASVTMSPSVSVAGGVTVCPLCSSEITQILNNIQLFVSYYEQTLQYAKQIQQYVQQLKDSVEMFRNGKALVAQVFGDLINPIQDLARVVQQGRGLAYSMANLDTNFRRTYQGYTTPRSFSADYKAWSATAFDTIQGTMKAMGLQASQMDSEASAINSMKLIAMRADGAVQVAMAGNQFAAETSQQMVKMRGLMLADMQSKQAYQAHVLQVDAAQKAATEALFRFTPQPSDHRAFKGGTL